MQHAFYHKYIVLNIKPKSHLNSKIVKVISNLDSCQSSELNYLIDKLLQKIGFDTQIIGSHLLTFLLVALKNLLLKPCN